MKTIEKLFDNIILPFIFHFLTVIILFMLFANLVTTIHPFTTIIVALMTSILIYSINQRVAQNDKTRI